jgi:KaiC/GvpD/RAD55 family RecA-like ATPase
MNIDYDKYVDEVVSSSKHAPFLPKNIFCIIAGSTGCGKTNLILNFLLNGKNLDYTNIYIYSSTLHQSKYKFLRDYYKKF